MKWTYSIQNKLKASLLLFIVLVIVLANNIRERKDSNELNTFMSSIYEDRLIAESYNFNILENVHQIITKTERTVIDDSQHRALNSNISQIKNILSDYQQTTLTIEEENHLKNLSSLIVKLETHYRSKEMQLCNEAAKESLYLLKSLSFIQVNEGKSIKTKADFVYSTSKLFSEFEMALIIVIGLLIQALVISSKTISINSNKPVGLN